MSMVEVKGLTKKFGKFTALDHVDLTIEEGEIYGTERRGEIDDDTDHARDAETDGRGSENLRQRCLEGRGGDS